MATPANLAASAYSAAQRYADPSRQTISQAFGEKPSGGFDDFLQSAIDQVASAGHKADTKTAQAVTGTADVVDVVTAVAESEAALQTLVAVRDKVIAAYEEIMRMPI